MRWRWQALQPTVSTGAVMSGRSYAEYLYMQGALVAPQNMGDLIFQISSC